MTEKRLAELRALAAKATPGPWERQLDRNDQENIFRGTDDWIALLPHQCLASLKKQQESNAAFIVAAREAVPELLAEVARLRGIVGRLVGDDEGTW